jgi:hypothetical protein
MQESPTWRTVLADILKRPGERQRIAGALGINQLTLKRWVQNQSDPRPQYLQQLLTLVPEQQTVLRSLLEQEFSEIRPSAGAAEEGPQEIASPFYAEVLQMLATRPLEQHPRSIRKRILQQAFDHLDPSGRSLWMTLARCVPPSTTHKVRSMQVMMGVGQPPWGGDLNQQTVFFGVESIAGRVASTGQPLTIEDLQETRLMVPPNISGLGSLSVYPLQHAGRIAGTFSVMRSEPGNFLVSCQTLIQQYSNLVALTFALEDFYAPEDIELYVMPLPPLQIPYLASFRQRVLEVMQEAGTTQQHMTNEQAEQAVWHHIEDELAHLVLSTER